MTIRRADIFDENPDTDPLAPAPEAGELWFLPAPDDADDLDEPDLSPLPRAPRAGLVEASAWAASEAGLAGDLAQLAFDLGRLSERVAVAGAGAVQRLALAEAVALSWWEGGRVASDRLALWLSYRVGAAGEEDAGLIRTGWAARRLMAPARGRGTEALIRATLEEAGQGPLALDVAEAMRGVDGLSAVTQGCALFHFWRGLEERPAHLAPLEAAVLGARLAAGQGGLPFLPLALTGFGALTAHGPPERKLAAWLLGSHRAVLSALMSLNRLAEWQGRAEAATGDLSGRVPQRLILALMSQPMLTAEAAERLTGASRAAVQRNLDLFTKRDLVREVTGAGRYRVWTAKL